MKAVIEKELRSYFCTAKGYVFIAVFLLIAGYFFITYNIINGNADVSVMLENTVVSFVLLIPVLTMGLFAGEKKAGTDSLYLSVPLAKWEIVFGKFIAAFLVFLCAVIINSFSAVVMVFFRGQTFGEVFAVYMGFILLGMAFISVGLFVSALTENQVISAVISLCVCFMLYLSDWLLETNANEVIKLLALPSYYSKFLVGIFDLRAAIYLLSFSALFIILTVLYIEKIEVKSDKKRDVVLIVTCVVASFLVLNYSVDKFSKKVQMTFDMSHNGIFELTDETKKYLEAMEDDVTIYYLAEEGNENPYIGEILSRYDGAAGRVQLKYVDLIKNPQFTAAYIKDNETIPKGAVIVESSKRFTVVEPETAFYVKRDTSGNISRELGFSLEQDLTQAIDYVLVDKIVTAVWLTGQGEKGYEKPAALLRKENIRTEYTDDIETGIKNADLLMIFAPSGDISQKEDAHIRAYLNSGGKLYMALNPGYETPRLKRLAHDCGMTIGDTVLTVDNLSELIKNNRLYLMTIPTRHKITDGLVGIRNLLFPVASPITIKNNDRYSVSNLAVTDSKTAARKLEKDALGEKTATGTFTVVAISENAENNSKVLLASSSQYLAPTNKELGDILEAYNYSNKDFFVKSVKYLLNHEDRLLIAPKSIMSRSLNLEAGTQVVLSLVFGLIFPVLAFVSAFIVFKRRRNR